MTPAFRLTLIWIAGCMLAFVTAMNYLPASLVDGNYIPVSNDSFYHARRILDTVANPNGFYEFDPYIHYPEGSWITWPWGYDYLMAQIVRFTIWTLGPRDPMTVLAYIPVFAIAITMALVLGISSVLGLSMPMRALVALVSGVSPLTQTMHGVGVVDHHFAEHICILLSILLGMLWTRAPTSRAWATALGIALGASVAIHNGLFIMQLPVLGAMLFAWLRREPIEQRSTACFALALCVTTLLVALPAEQFRRGEFQFYLLSWFHVYVASCTSLVAVLLSRWPFNPRQSLWLGGTVLALLIPLAAQLIVGGEFVSGRMAVLQVVDEAQSPVTLAFHGAGAWRISQLYGLFVWLSPLWFIVSIAQLIRDPRPEFRFFWIVATGTLVLMMFQLRFFYYGSLAVYVVPFWCFDQLRHARPRFSKAVLGAAAVIAAASLVPPLKSILYTTAAPSLDPTYANTRSLYPVLASACERAPGVALAGANEGHYVRFHTDCYVIANNFRMTEQHAERLVYMDYLWSMSPQQLLTDAPEVRYVLASLIGAYTAQPGGSRKPTTEEILREVNSRLDVDLLTSKPGTLPSRFLRLSEITLPDLPFPIAAVYEVLPPDARAATRAGASALKSITDAS